MQCALNIPEDELGEVGHSVCASKSAYKQDVSHKTGVI